MYVTHNILMHQNTICCRMLTLKSHVVRISLLKSFLYCLVMMTLKRETIISLAVLVVAVVLFSWVVYPSFVSLHTPLTSGELEPFLGTVNTDVSKLESGPAGPNPSQSSLVDGPGFEKGDEYMYGSQLSTSGTPSSYYYIDDGANGEMSIQHNMCSKSCCSEQWPTPHMLKHDPYVCGNKNEFVPSNIFCNNSFQDSGCLCLTKDQSKFLVSRGGNGNDLF